MSLPARRRAIAALLAVPFTLTACTSTGAAPAAEPAVADELGELDTEEPQPQLWTEDARNADWPLVSLLADLGGSDLEQGWSDTPLRTRPYLEGETDAADDVIRWNREGDFAAANALLRLWADEVGFRGHVSTAWYPDGQAVAARAYEPPRWEQRAHLTVSRLDVPIAESEAIWERVEADTPELKAAADVNSAAINDQLVADGGEPWTGWPDPDSVETVAAPDVDLPEAHPSQATHSSGRVDITVSFRLAPYAFAVSYGADGSHGTAEVRARAVELATEQYEHARSLLADPYPARTLQIDTELLDKVENLIPGPPPLRWWWEHRETLDDYLDRMGHDPGSERVRFLTDGAGYRTSSGTWYANSEVYEDASTSGWVILTEFDDPARYLDATAGGGWDGDATKLEQDLTAPGSATPVTMMTEGDGMWHVQMRFVAGDHVGEVGGFSKTSLRAARSMASRLSAATARYISEEEDADV
jgi:hypothetical protein